MHRLQFFIIALIIIAFSGCSGNSITSPESQIPKTDSSISSLPVWVSDYDSSGNPVSGEGVFGLFNVHISPDTLTGEMSTLRKGSLADVLEVVDISNFLSLAPCTDCVKIRGIQIDADNHLVLKIGIRHPFPAGDIFKPISGRNRADLHVFNVEGIIVSDGSGPTSFPNLNITTGGFSLINSDGYTGYLDSSIDEFFPTASSIHPFITHFADYSEGNYNPSNPMGFESVTSPPPSGNLVMPMGSNEDVKNYIFDLPAGDVNFIFAVGCTYAVSAANKAQRFTPEFRIPQHNKKAASHVNIIVDSNDLRAGDTASTAQFTIEVLDINHGVAVGTDLNQMRADSSVSAIQIEIPGVTTSPVSISVTPVSGNGRDPADPLKFTGTVTNTAGAAEGTFEGIVKVTDAYPTGLNESPLLSGKDGIKRVGPIDNPLTGLIDITEFATYQRFSILVETGNLDPVAVLAPDPANGCNACTIWFNGTQSYDTDGTIVTYEFDFDLQGGNPANFTADTSGASDRAQSPVYSTGNYTAALKVIDNLGASNIDTVQVQITPIDGFDPAPYPKVYVSDPSFTNIVFTPNGNTPDDTQNRQLGLEAMARGDQYLFAVFYATGPDGSGLYIARSGDNGSTWGDYILVRTITSGYEFSGAAIDVVGSEVFIATAETLPDYSTSNFYFAYNGNNAEGTFDVRQLSNSNGYSSITIAVDPADTNNIYCGVAEKSFWHHYDYYWIYTSNTGPTGTFNSQQTHTWYLPPPFGYYNQAYTGELKVAPDRDVYLFETANYSTATYKSTDFGTTFTELSAGWDYQGAWGRDADTCFDPNNSEMIHWVITYRTPSAYRHSYRRSTNGGTSWNVISGNLNGSNTTAYTNAALTTDSSGGLYIVFNDKISGNGEVYGLYSNNGGSSFGSLIQISNDPGNDANVEIVPTTNGCDIVVGWVENFDGTPRVVSRRG